MKIHQCGSCGAKFDISKFTPGKKIRCARCKEVFEVPADEPAPPADEPSDEAAVPAAAAPPAPSDEESPPEDPEPPPLPKARAKPAAKAAPAEESEEPGEEEAAAPPSKPSRVPAAGKGGTSRLARGGAAGEASPRRSRAARGGAEAPAKKTSKGLIIAEVLGGLAVVGGIAFYMLQDPGPPPKKTLADATSFEEAEKATEKDKIPSLIALADWCKSKNMPEKRDEVLQDAYGLNPRSEMVIGKLTERVQERIAALKADDAPGHWEIVQWCDARGLKEIADKETDLILEKIDKQHEGANKRKGNVLVDGEWLDAKTASDFLKDKAEKEKREAELAAMGPRGKTVMAKLQAIDGRFGAGTYDYLDTTPKGAPYLLALQKDPRVPADIRLEELGDVMTALYKLWFTLYGEKFELKEFDEAVLVIWVYASEKAYRDSGAPPKAAAHFEPMTGIIVVNNELQDPYGVLFHEGIHQLVDYSTRARGGNRNNKFWFTEGVATYFEIFERRGADFILGRTRPANNPYLSTSKDLVRREHAMKLAEFIDLDYGAAQQSNTTYSHYAQSWALTHFLNKYEEGKYQAKFEEYFKDEVAGQGGPEAFKRIFGDLDVLEKEWAEYIDGLK